MRLPEVREELRNLSTILADVSRRMEVLACEISRRPMIKRAESHSARMTRELEAQIRAYALAHPELSQQVIGMIFNVHSGRVSEAVRGKRT